MNSGPRQRTSAILHVDMDAFFASVEQRDDPRLRGKPVIVGGPSKRGVVAAASYEVRRFGVRSAMPIVEAMRRCPQAIIVPPHHRRYADASDDVFSIFRRFTPLVEGLSLDEAFLDVTGSQALFGDAVAIAQQIRGAIRRELDLTCSAGVAPCKFAAKIASDLNKPDGLTIVPPADVAGFLAPLAVERMWGIGKVAAERMHRMGIRAIGDLAKASPADLAAVLGKWGYQVHALACGRDPRPVVPTWDPKSVGAEETFAADVREPTELRRHLLAQSGRVARRLHAQGLSGRVVVVKVKLSTFKLLSARQTLPRPVDDTDSIYAAAKELLARLPLADASVRLTGVAVCALHPRGAGQGELFGDPMQERRRDLQRITGAIQDRFGKGSIVRATLLGGNPTPQPGSGPATRFEAEEGAAPGRRGG